MRSAQLLVAILLLSALEIWLIHLCRSENHPAWKSLENGLRQSGRFYARPDDWYRTQTRLGFIAMAAFVFLLTLNAIYLLTATPE